MRVKIVLCGLTTLVPALLLAGCAMDQSTAVVANVQSPTIQGRAFGGQQPVTGSTIEVVAMGTTGYGSAGTILATTTTNSNGQFSFAAGAYTCPQSNTPVYLLGIGGNPGLGAGINNASAVEAAALGTCSQAQQSFVVLNEVTTAATAYAFSHFFSTATPVNGSAAGNDSIGGPASTAGSTVTYSTGLQFANNYTIPLLVSNATGVPNQGGSNGVTTEWQKIYTIANVIGACINSSGATSATETKTTCGKLFNYTKNGAATRPADTLQAAVQMALHPTTDVTNLYGLIPPQPAFPDYLTSAPNDWSVGVSFTSSALGLGVDRGTTSTLDIDTSNRIWFPSNGSAPGAAYFDPSTDTFYGPFNTTGLMHPQQVAIDANGYAWYNDRATSTVAGYLVSAPTSTESLSLPNTISTALTVTADDRINVGVTNGSLYQLGYIAADRSTYKLGTSVTFTYPTTSLAGDNNNGVAEVATDNSTTTMRNYYITSGPSENFVKAANDDSGQVIFTGNDDVSVRSYSGSGNANDGLCIYSAATCYNFAGGYQNQAEGIAIDGGGQLWVAEALDAGVLQVPVNNPGASKGSVYLNSSGASNIPVHELIHDANNGGTLVTPYGIGVDVAGDVWVSNAGCTTTSCTPDAFTLTEIVGAGYPTITPVSAQITSGTDLVGTEPTY